MSNAVNPSTRRGNVTRPNCINCNHDNCVNCLECRGFCAGYDAVLGRDSEPTNRAPAPGPRKKAPRKKAPPATHYKTICISIYTTDVRDLDAKVAELKRRGIMQMSKSQLIRIALKQLDLDRVVLLTRDVQ